MAEGAVVEGQIVAVIGTTAVIRVHLDDGAERVLVADIPTVAAVEALKRGEFIQQLMASRIPLYVEQTSCGTWVAEPLLHGVPSLTTAAALGSVRPSELYPWPKLAQSAVAISPPPGPLAVAAQWVEGVTLLIVGISVVFLVGWRRRMVDQHTPQRDGQGWWITRAGKRLVGGTFGFGRDSFASVEAFPEKGQDKGKDQP